MQCILNSFYEHTKDISQLMGIQAMRWALEYVFDQNWTTIKEIKVVLGNSPNINIFSSLPLCFLKCVNYTKCSLYQYTFFVL